VRAEKNVAPEEVSWLVFVLGVEVKGRVGGRRRECSRFAVAHMTDGKAKTADR
jgi:hypothetical protein